MSVVNSQPADALTIENVRELLANDNLHLVMTRTIHADGGKNFYQIKDHDGKIYPKSRNNKEDVGESTIITCVNQYGIKGLRSLFDLPAH